MVSPNNMLAPRWEVVAHWLLVYLIFFIIVGNQAMHKSLDEFEFLPGPITDYAVSCHWASEKYSFPRFSQPFLLRSFDTYR